MKLRPYRYGEDFETVAAWITDERTHALWCARRFPWPLAPEGFEGKLRELEEKGDRPFLAVTEEGFNIALAETAHVPLPTAEEDAEGEADAEEDAEAASEAYPCFRYALFMIHPSVA